MSFRALFYIFLELHFDCLVWIAAFSGFRFNFLCSIPQKLFNKRNPLCSVSYIKIKAISWIAFELHETDI